MCVEGSDIISGIWKTFLYQLEDNEEYYPQSPYSPAKHLKKQNRDRSSKYRFVTENGVLIFVKVIESKQLFFKIKRFRYIS
jgi:hypothetical protein